MAPLCILKELPNFPLWLTEAWWWVVEQLRIYIKLRLNYGFIKSFLSCKEIENKCIYYEVTWTEGCWNTYLLCISTGHSHSILFLIDFFFLILKKTACFLLFLFLWQIHYKIQGFKLRIERNKRKIQKSWRQGRLLCLPWYSKFLLRLSKRLYIF